MNQKIKQARGIINASLSMGVGFMKITAFILAHYKQREDNLKRIIDDLLKGSLKPEQIVVFIDNPEIDFEDKRAIIIRSNKPFLPKVRFALGSYFETDYCFFIDDDLTVRKDSLSNFKFYANKDQDKKAIYGVRGSILADTKNPYADDTSIKQGDVDELTEVDVVLRSYFVPRGSIPYGILLQSYNPDLPSEYLDDVYLSLGNKYLNRGKNYVIPVDETCKLDQLNEGGVGQSISGKHYENRNKVCRILMDRKSLYL